MVVKKKYPTSRKNHIIQMYDWGKKGEGDYDHKHKSIIKPIKQLTRKTKYGRKLRKLPSKFDVQGYDMPRADIQNMKLKGRTIRVGNEDITNVEYFRKKILPQMQNMFTKEEVKLLNVYLEYPNEKIHKMFAGLTEGWTSDNSHSRYNIIDISLNQKNDLYTIIHELVHALRFARKDTTRDIDKDESETDLEAIARLPASYIKNHMQHADLGYYQLLPGGRRNIIIDKKMIDTKCTIGKRMPACIKSNLKHSKIGKISIPNRFVPKLKINPEYIDRTFMVELPDRNIIIEGYKITNTHAFVQKYIDMYGKNIKVYEWMDGKKKIIYQS